ncbi:hypothetical protein [Bacillus benzoevorans]|uniref:Uncharacterized protein n=1 Tax=Bacillus benzoevorans TaxID=1456 RepID=A0A7X0HVH2_9BACI|nr:hypothetical protein [Bacillus benzoevorans]MBB6447649.1 hypothetical protein [Bacillus benzoevorans]
MYRLQIVDTESKTIIVEHEFYNAEIISFFIENCENPEGSYYSMINEDNRYLSCEYVNHVVMTCGEDTFYRVYFKTELNNVYA